VADVNRIVRAELKIIFCVSETTRPRVLKIFMKLLNDTVKLFIVFEISTTVARPLLIVASKYVS
jgi:hypothetical protein